MHHCTSPGSSVLVSDGSYLICFSGVGFFFSFPYFQIKETETFHAIECKLCAALKQTEHFNMYLFTPAPPSSSSWAMLFLLLGSCGQAAIRGASGSPYKYPPCCSCWRSWAVRSRRLYKQVEFRVTHLERLFSPVGSWQQRRATLPPRPPAVRSWGWWQRRGGGTTLPDVSERWGRLVWDSSPQPARWQARVCGFPVLAPLWLFAAPVTVPHARQTLGIEKMLRDWASSKGPGVLGNLYYLPSRHVNAFFLSLFSFGLGRVAGHKNLCRPLSPIAQKCLALSAKAMWILSPAQE